MDLFEASSKPASFAGIRIGFRKIGEGKQICRKENAGERLSVARRLRKTMIEAASARAGDVSDDAVHHLAALLVGVEILVEKMTEKPPALRNTDSVDALYRRRGLRIVFQIGEKIADRSKAEASDDGIFRFVNDLINFAGLKSAIQMNEMRIGRRACHPRCEQNSTGCEESFAADHRAYRARSKHSLRSLDRRRDSFFLRLVRGENGREACLPLFARA